MSRPTLPPLESYLRRAMRRAVIRRPSVLEDWSATIPGFKGLIAFAATRRQIRPELRSVLEGWCELSLRRGHGLPQLPSG